MCGVFGIVSNEQVATQIPFGLYDLNHRGEQAIGIATSDGIKIYSYKEAGLVTEVFSDEGAERGTEKERIIKSLPGKLGIGHTLYSTVGRTGEEKQTKTFQPLIGNFHGNDFALAHNGNLINLDPLRREAEENGYKFQSNVSDTEVIVALLSISRQENFIDALREVLPRLSGAFTLVILLKDKVIGVRDRFGIRPLCIGGLNDSSFVVASEECALHTLTGNFIREVRPGELVVLSSNGIDNAFLWADSPKLRLCIAELIYFARPDSTIADRRVYCYRENAGREVALEIPTKGDVVSCVPESGAIYNYGVSQASGIPVRRVISRNRYYAGRTFLAPRETNRKALQRAKFYILRELVKEKVVVITEDSIIRANVSPEVVMMLRTAGAAEVHLRVGSAPIRYPCFLGIDIPTQKELVAANRTEEEIRQIIKVDSLGYLSLKGMIKASGLPEENLCLGCFTGKYPIDPPKDLL
jgi:amidophosphoribosyltransferase